MPAPEDFMRRAVELSRESLADGEGGPFGAVVVRDGTIVGEGRNRVLAVHDPTAHAEVQAIRAACVGLGTHDLSGCVIYTSCEPCPMCLAAILWARLDAIHYGNGRDDAAAIGFDDALFYEEVAKPMERRRVPHGRLLADEARAVFRDWAASAGRRLY